MTEIRGHAGSRRRFLASGVALGFAAWEGSRTTAYSSGRGRRLLRAEIRDVRVISRQPQYYHGWPTLTQRRSGELLVVCSGGRSAHVCPFGRVELIRSRDGGETWSWPQVLLDGPIDDRDAGILETSKGILLATSFSSLAYEPLLMKMGMDDSRRDHWMAAHQRATEADRSAALGVWMIRSSDGGMTWSRRYDCLVNSPHSPIELSDGRLLYAGKDLWRSKRIGISVSSDDGKTWQWLTELPARDGDDPREYHELHAVEADSGRIIVQIRNHNPQNNRETLQCESDDNGTTWTKPHAIDVWGLPSHLLRLSDGRLLMTYGHRRPPYGNQARVSEDQGRTWSDPIMLSTDGSGGDLGYPSTVERPDGTLVTVWYEKLASQPLAVLRQARWKL